MKRSLLAVLLITFGFFTSPVMAQEGGGSTAYLETRLSALEEQMRSLNGQVEQLSFAIRRLDQGVQKMQADYDARLSKLENSQTAAPPPPTTVAAGDTSQPPSANGTLGAIKTQDGRIVGGSVSPQAPPLPTAPPDYGLTAQEQYDRAFGLLRQADYDAAEKAFKAFIDKNPKDKLVDNAKYWYAETLYVRARFADAAVAFADAFQQNPQGTKAPDSLLKLAMSLAATDKIPDACVALGELQSKYPAAAASIRSRASEEQSKLKCGH